MAEDRLSVTPLLEAYNTAITQMAPHDKLGFFLHDFTMLLLKPSRIISNLGVDNDAIFALLEQDEGKRMVERGELRTQLVTAIEQASIQAQEVESRIDAVQGRKYYKERLGLAITQLRLLQKFAPVFLESFDYFSSLDPSALERLRSQRIDVRDLCEFFDTDCMPGEDYAGDYQIDGARTVILFNLLRNATEAELDHNELLDMQLPKRRLILSHNSIQISNHSAEPVPTDIQNAMRSAKIEGIHYGLFISSYYVAVVGDQIELAQAPIDPMDEGTGYNISFTLSQRPR